MALIDSEEAAKRLARVILSDIELYNREKIKTGADLKAELAEGAALFRARVVPSLVPLFDTVVADKRAGKSAAPRPAARAPEPVRAPEASDEPELVYSRTAPEASAPARVESAVARAEAALARAEARPEPMAPPPDRTPAPRGPDPTAESPVLEVEAAAPRPITHEPTRPTVDERPAVRTPAPMAVAAPRPAPIPVQAPAPVPQASPDVDTAPNPAATPLRPATASPRTGPIDSEESARRLARVIISDIEIYNTKKIAAGADLTSEISEGRSLFKSRVAAEFLPVFEQLLSEKNLARLSRSAAAAPVERAAAPRAEAPRPVATPIPPPPAASVSPPPPRAPARSPRDVGTPPPMPPPMMAGRTPTPSPRAPKAPPTEAPAFEPPTPMVMTRPAPVPRTPVAPPPAQLSVEPAIVENAPLANGVAVPTPAPTEPTLPVPAALVAEMAPGAAVAPAVPAPAAKRSSFTLFADGQGKPSTARMIVAAGAVVSAALLIYYLWTL